MQARLGKWVDYVDESHWRFGLVLIAITAIQGTLIVVVLFR